MKLCIACKHKNGGSCIRPTGKVSPVDGRRSFYNNWCESERSRLIWIFGGCGPSGRHFEPADSQKIERTRC